MRASHLHHDCGDEDSLNTMFYDYGEQLSPAEQRALIAVALQMIAERAMVSEAEILRVMPPSRQQRNVLH